MRCPQLRPATISCRQTMAMSKPPGGGAAGIGAAGGAGEWRRLNVPISNAHDQRPSANSELLAGDCKFPIGDAPLPGERPGLAHLFSSEPVKRGRFVNAQIAHPSRPVVLQSAQTRAGTAPRLCPRHSCDDNFFYLALGKH